MSLFLHRSGILKPTAVAVPSLSFLTSDTTTANETTYTFSLTFGAAASDRKLIMVFATRTEGTSVSASSATIGGVSATKIEEAQTGAGSGDKYVVIFIADVPTGTSGDWVINLSGSGGGMAGIACYRVVDLGSSTAHDTATDANADPLSTTLNIPENGFAIGGSANGDGTGTAWTGLTEDVDAATQSTLMQFSAASDSEMSQETGRTIESNGAGNDGCLVAASWGN